MKNIILSQRLTFLKKRNEYRDSIDIKLLEFISRFNILPYCIPNMLSEKELIIWCEKINPIGIILSGGGEIGEFKKRDDTEKSLLNFAKSKSLPVLGICRGMQFLAYFDGVGLTEIEGHVSIRHKINGVVGSRTVNSYHNYTINNCPKNYEVIAYDDNNNIEAIKHVNLPWEGWMWHPEREKKFSKFDLERFRKLFI